MTLKKPLILLIALVPLVLLAGCRMPTGKEKFEHKGWPVSRYEAMLKTTAGPDASDAERMKILAERRVAAEALGQLGSAAEHADSLAVIAGNPTLDVTLRTRATWALGMLRAENYNGLLIRLLREGFDGDKPLPAPDPHWAIRDAAAFGLGRIGSFESRAPLEELRELETEGTVKKTINRALEGLSPIDFNIFPSTEESSRRTFLEIEVGVEPDTLNNNLEQLIDFLEIGNRSYAEFKATIYERHPAPSEDENPEGIAEDQPDSQETLLTAAGGPRWTKGIKVASHQSWTEKGSKQRGMDSMIRDQRFDLQSWRKGQGLDKKSNSNFLPMLLLFLVFTYFWTSRLARQASKGGGGAAAK